MAKLKHILPPSIVDTPPSLLESAFAWMGVSQSADSSAPSAGASESVEESASISVSASSSSSPASSVASSPSKPRRSAAASPNRAANQTPPKSIDDGSSAVADGPADSVSCRASDRAPVISLFQQQTSDTAAGPLAALMAQRR